MPVKPSLSLLFHPKKGAKKETPARKAQVAARPKPQPERDEIEEPKLPDGSFQEFRLLSSALNGWKYDVMKFDSRKPIDISKWQAPIKLNRKDLRRDDTATTNAPEAVRPMLGPDGKPVIGADGKMVMVDIEGKPIHATEGTGGKEKSKGSANGKKRFQKKTRQVFYVPEEVRQLRREERYPWVMEDSSPAQNEIWIGQMDDVSKSETHAFFMPAANDIFKFVPAHRWYKFQKKLKHDLPTDTANVESLYSQSQKRDPQAWLASRNGKGPSASTAAMFKAEAEGRTISIGNSLVHNASQSLGPGGRKLKAVDSGMNGLFDDEDGEFKRRREREFGGEGDLDEQVYEEDFADDDEKMDVDDNDEEAKEIEERLKREYKTANKQRDTGVDDDSEEDEDPTVSRQTKAMQKIIRNREGNDAYETDEEKNPYASSEEEVEEEDTTVPQGPAIQPQQSESRSQTPKLNVSRPPPTGANSRASSPSQSMGGHSIVAKRATSPKAPKLKSTNPTASRGNSPLGSRATSPAAGSRHASPVATQAGTPRPDQGQINGAAKTVNANKRKAEELNTASSPGPLNGQAPKPKKRKSGTGTSLVATPAELEVLLVDWLKNTPDASTRDCIHHFTPYLTDSDKKSEFSTMVRKVAQLKNGVLALRQRASSAPSPSAS